MTDIGGQAVIEGVMMKSNTHMAVAVRLPDNKTSKRGAGLCTSIKTKKEKLRKFKKIWTLPFVRGIFQLVYLLVLGVKALIWSSNQQLEEKEKITNKEITFTLIISFGFAAGLFIVAPFLITKIFISTGFFFHLLDGVIRIIIFLAYLIIISFSKDVKTMFQYHGAEHKTIYCYEDKKPLTVKNCRKYTTLHPRCGTAFILIVLVISILVFSLVRGTWIINLIARILLLPVIAGLSYELLKLSARFKCNPVIRAVTYPGLLLQKLTTREPTDKQLEVAIKSLKTLLK